MSAADLGGDVATRATPGPAPGAASAPRWAPWRRRRSAVALAAGSVVVVGTLARVPGLHRKLVDRQGFRQTQTAYTIRELARHGMHLLHPPLPVLGPPWTVAMEFPLFQAVAALMVRGGLSSDLAGRLLGLASFEATAVVLFLLVRRMASLRAAFVALVLFQVVPLDAQFGFASLIEFFATAFCIASVLAAWRWFETGRWWWLPLAAASCAVGWLTKVTTGVAWVPPLVVLAFMVVRTDWRRLWRRVVLGLAVAPGAGLVVSVWWTRYSDAEKAHSQFTAFLVSNKLYYWNFGPVSERLSLHNQALVMQRTTDLITGPLPLLVAAVVAIAMARHNRLLKLSLVAVPVVGTQIFFNLYVHHDYYQCAVVPAYVAVMAIGIDEAATRVRSWRPRRGWWHPRAAAAATAAVALAAVAGGAWSSPLGSRVATNLAHRADHIPWQARELRADTPAGAQVLTAGCSWDARYLYYSDRRGLMLPRFADLRARHEVLSKSYVADNYRYVLNCDSPRYLNVLPPWIQLRRVAPALYEIVGVDGAPYSWRAVVAGSRL